jgi:hypothetical protein
MTIRRLFPIILICFLCILAVSAAPDPDMWWHLRTGEFILAHGIPRSDVFSYTVAGSPWVAHEWLTEVIMWVTYRASGLLGLNLAFAAIIVGAFWLTYLACDARPFVASFVVVLASLTSFFSIGIRPQMLNMLFFAAYILVVERWKDGCAEARVSHNQPPAGLLWLLPLFGAIWANLHSGFMLGVVLLVTYSVGEGIQLWAGRRDERGLEWSGVRRLALVAVATLAAALINPHGYKILTYSYETLGAYYVSQGWVLEWASPTFHNITGWPFGAMLLLGAACWALAPRRAALTDVLLFVGTAAAALVSARHMALFAIASTPIISRSIARCLEGTRFHDDVIGKPIEPPPTTLRRVLYWSVAVGMVLLAVVHGDYNVRAFAAATPRKYPVRAVDFIERQGLAGEHCFNNYGWGGYLIWRGIPVFIDGRADVYGDAFILKYVKPYFVQEDWRAPLDEYDVRYALIERDGAMRTLLLASGEWREIYLDDLASVLVRASAPVAGKADGG